MKFLTHDGLLYFWKKAKNYIDTKLNNYPAISDRGTMCSRGTVTDANQAIDSGVYEAWNNVINLPDSASQIGVLLVARSTTFIMQIYATYSGNVWTRSRGATPDEWTAWTNIKGVNDLFVKNVENLSTKSITLDDGVGSWIPFKSCRTINGEKFSASLAVGANKSLSLELRNETTGAVLSRIDFRADGADGGKINAEKLGGYTRSTSNATGYHITQLSTTDIIAGTSALSSGTVYIVYE